MRRNYRLVIVILIINIILTACGDRTNKSESKVHAINNKNNANDPEKVQEYSVKDYFPFKENTLYEYQGIGDEYAQQKTYMEYIEDGRAQMKIYNLGMNIIKILEYKDGMICEVYSEGSIEHVENKIDVVGKEESIVLKEPLQIGNKWDISNGRTRKITGLDVKVDIPYGKVEALEVTTDLGDSRKQIDYYSLNIGHVASIYKDGDFEVKTLLNKIHKGPIESKLRFFYPLGDGTGTIYKDRKVSFKTNDKIEELLEDKMRNPENETLIPLISKVTNIKSLKMDRANNILKVDFNEEFIKDNIEMGSFLENEIIQSIVNTLGGYYETNKVFISVEGVPYESGHMLLKEGEYFETTDDALKIVD